MTMEMIAVGPASLMPALTVEQAVQRRETMIQYVKALLQEGVDYGKIPGSRTDALYKAGAEKFASLFGLVASFDTIESVRDWTGAEHGGEPFFFWQYRCLLRRNGELVGEGNGSCNSWESKYRYRTAERVCQACGQATIIKGREEYGGGWVCFVRKGGCGVKYRDGDPLIEEQQVGRIKNPDIADIVNTVDKMAQKRALVAAILVTCNASEFFTQDVEDFYEAAAPWLERGPAAEGQPVIEGQATETRPEPRQAERKTPEAPRPAPASRPHIPEQSRRLPARAPERAAPAEPAEAAPPDEPAAPALPAREIQAMVSRLQSLRKAERAAGQEPPAFKWDQAEGETPLVREIKASRKRLYELAKERGLETAVPLAQILDDALFALLEIADEEAEGNVDTAA